MDVIMTPSRREALFNGAGLGDLTGGVAPFFLSVLEEHRHDDQAQHYRNGDDEAGDDLSVRLVLLQVHDGAPFALGRAGVCGRPGLPVDRAQILAHQTRLYPCAKLM